MMYFYVFIGGGLGCLARFSLTQFVSHLIKSSFPLGTFLTNMFACLLLALFVIGAREYSDHSSWIQPLLIIGFCGGFSTFSAFSNESVQLIDQGNVLLAALNIFISVAVGIALIYFIKAKA
ncbi:MAG: fluoride efflux transporter CrcB [Bacteroidetes bacterium]|nr:MAG: fluoride efflux transporter CrcB [Bacteroidota bacterium]